MYAKKRLTSEDYILLLLEQIEHLKSIIHELTQDIEDMRNRVEISYYS